MTTHSIYWMETPLASAPSRSRACRHGRRAGGPAVPTRAIGLDAGLTIQDSTYKKRVEPKRLAEGAPNILIILMDDVGPATRPRPTAARSTRRRSTGWRRWACPSTAFIPPRCARRRGPRCSPGATTRGSATARSRRSPTISTASAESSRSRRRRWPKCSRTTATAPAPGANGTTRPRSRSPAWGRSTTGRPVMASSTSTASWRAKLRNTSRH